MAHLEPTVRRQKAIMVPSRFRQHPSQSRPDLCMSLSANQVLPRASSPRHENQKTSFNIHDSFASVIRPEPDSQLREFSNSSSLLQHADSVPDITVGCKENKLPSKLTKEVNFDFRKQAIASLLIWKVLDQHANEAQKEATRKGEEKCKIQLEELRRLQIVVAEKLKIKKWMSSWLIAQRSIDTQIDVLQRLNTTLKGPDSVDDSCTSPGLLPFLQYINDSLLEPSSHRLPTEGINCSPQKLVSAVATAHSVQTQFCEAVESELRGLRQLASQLEAIKSSSFSKADGARLAARVVEAGHLCTHLASLRAHKIQSAIDPTYF